ncbi:MAG: hypothetical protein VX519_02880 [Myxococcota bacterium]|nr:hypothetical protein [Myxococcota bacterium]
MFGTLLLWMTGCAPPIHGAYADARLDALGDAPALREDWGAESVVYLEGKLVQSVVRRLLDKALTEKGMSFQRQLPLGATAKLRPELSVDRLKFSSNSRCPTCFSVDASLSGLLWWSVGKNRGRIPANLVVNTDFFIRTSWEEDGSRLELVLAEIRHIEAGSGQFRGISPQGEVAQWAHARMVEAAKPVYLGTVGGPNLPLSDIRVLPAKAGTRIELATNASARTPILTPSPPMTGDWIGGVSTPTILSLIRRAAFEAGEIMLEVHADPTALHVEGNTFTLDLRLWRLAGRGWWRDYQVTGQIVAHANRVRFKAENAVEIAHSRRAGVVDPLALLAKGQLLEAIESGCNQIIPIPKKASIGDEKLSLKVTSIEGIDNVIWLSGTAQLTHEQSATPANTPTVGPPPKPSKPTVGPPPK